MATVKLYDNESVRVFEGVHSLDVKGSIRGELIYENGTMSPIKKDTQILIPESVQFVSIEAISEDYLKIFLSHIPGVERSGSQLHIRQNIFGGE